MATIKDVARASGVSTTTVSEVINNGWRPVNTRTRQRVLKAAQELAYSPSALARGLVGKRMNTLGLVFTQEAPPQTSPFLLEALLGVIAVSGAHKQNTMIFHLDHWGQVLKRVPQMCDGRCDGILLMVPPDDSPLPEALRLRKVPCVLVSTEDPAGQTPSVDVDNRRTAFEMTNALLEMGHRRIAFVSTPHMPDVHLGFVRDRHEGYRQAMMAAGMHDPLLDDLSTEGAAIESLRSQRPPTAFFCVYDGPALHLLEQLQRHGIRVPEDVSVAGFDDIPAAAQSRPTLSTVRQPIRRLGERAVEMLLALIDADSPVEPGHRELLPTELVFRESTASPRR